MTPKLKISWWFPPLGGNRGQLAEIRDSVPNWKLFTKLYKLEVAKFMAKVNLSKLSVFCSNQSTIFRTLSSICTDSIWSASSKSFYVQRTSLVKTNQLLKISGVKIWNSLPGHIRDKVLTSSDKTSSKILKLYFLKSRTCLYAKSFLLVCI